MYRSPSASGGNHKVVYVRIGNGKGPIFVILSISLLLFIPLFFLKGTAFLDFWWWFTANVVILLGLVFYFDRNFSLLIINDFKNKFVIKIVIGFASAAILYLIFFIGDFITRWIFAFAQDEIFNIYRFKGDASLLRITLLMFLIIGPGEELFWRGYVQRVLSKKYGSAPGFFLAAGLYTFIHISSGNPMLVLAAFVCGIYWGWIYMRKGSLILNIVSHVVWDIAVFVVFPFKG